MEAGSNIVWTAFSAAEITIIHRQQQQQTHQTTKTQYF